MLKLSNVNFKYNEHTIFRELNSEFGIGMYGIFGKSGSGKSTLLKLLRGDLKPEKGKITLDEKKYGKKDVAYLAQDFKIIDELSVFDNVENGDIREKKSSKELDNIINYVGLENKSNELVVNLSGGEKQRVAIACCIAQDSKIILCDEPTGNLDEKNSNQIFKLLKDISANKLIIVISHDVEMKKYCDSIINIKNNDFEYEKTIFPRKFKYSEVKIERNPNTIGEVKRYKKNFLNNFAPVALITIILVFVLISSAFGIDVLSQYTPPFKYGNYALVELNREYETETYEKYGNLSDDKYEELSNNNSFEIISHNGIENSISGFVNSTFDKPIKFEKTLTFVDDEVVLPYEYYKDVDLSEGEMAVHKNTGYKIGDRVFNTYDEQYYHVVDTFDDLNQEAFVVEKDGETRTSEEIAWYAFEEGVFSVDDFNYVTTKMKEDYGTGINQILIKVSDQKTTYEYFVDEFDITTDEILSQYTYDIRNSEILNKLLNIIKIIFIVLLCLSIIPILLLDKINKDKKYSDLTVISEIGYTKFITNKKLFKSRVIQLILELIIISILLVLVANLVDVKSASVLITLFLITIIRFVIYGFKI